MMHPKRPDIHDFKKVYLPPDDVSQILSYLTLLRFMYSQTEQMPKYDKNIYDKEIAKLDKLIELLQK